MRRYGYNNASPAEVAVGIVFAVVAVCVVGVAVRIGISGAVAGVLATIGLIVLAAILAVAFRSPRASHSDDWDRPLPERIEPGPGPRPRSQSWWSNRR